MSVIVNLLISHLLAMIETSIEAEVPTIIAEIELLISKLEGYLKSKWPQISEDVDPVLDNVGEVVPSVVNTMVSALQSPVSTPSLKGTSNG